MSASELEEYPQFYSQEEIQQILNLAIARKADKGELSRQQLWEIAAELDIDSDCMRAAEQDWLKRKILEQKRQEFDAYRQESFKQKAARYLIVNGFSLALNFLTASTLSWSLYILLIWGIGLALEAWKTFHLKGNAYEEAFKHWYFRQELKQSVESVWQWIKKAWQS